mmetsp:Transcript_63729/g.103052  ORF Transcript_63729/g.103052 Transcript_63729/m.103052 type:complete len:133 (+) Transcript_63729:113-511(+)
MSSKEMPESEASDEEINLNNTTQEESGEEGGGCGEDGDVDMSLDGTPITVDFTCLEVFQAKRRLLDQILDRIEAELRAMDSAHKEMQDSQKRHKENIFEQSTKLQVQQELKDNFKQQMEAFAAAWQGNMGVH